MVNHYQTALVAVAVLAGWVSGSVPTSASKCEVLAQTESGWVCGSRRVAHNGVPYASFRGVPYAKQPLGELRFKELQPARRWRGIYNATVEGPICPYHDIFYGPLLAPQGVSEACIHANVHVPLHALPRGTNSPRKPRRLPILVYIHGGGWICGSGDSDVNGPEYLVGKDVIVVTFNYRLDALGFLSLNTTKVPGNRGLRDMVTLLRWVQRNAPRFGGDPRAVTLAGQSAGATSAHLLALSPVTRGLFNRVWLMSGTAIPSYYTTSPKFTQQVTDSYLTILGLNGTDLDTVHDRLVRMPIEVLHNASGLLLAQFGITTFVPVVESPLPNVTAMVTDDPEILIANGNGNDIPLVIGFTSDECETNRPRLTEINAVELYNSNPLMALSPHFIYTLPLEMTSAMAEKVSARYFGGEATMDKFISLCTDTYFKYPALRVARARAAGGGAPAFLYRFGYEAEQGPFRQAFNLSFAGAGHAEDLTHVLKVNSWPLEETSLDNSMKEWLSDMVANFVKKGEPSLDNSWPQSTGDLQYNNIVSPQEHQVIGLTSEDKDMMEFFDTLADL